MATTYQVIAQSAPSATTQTDILTVAAATQYVVSTIFVCNRGTTDATFRIAVRPDGAALGNAHYMAYDAPIEANTFLAITCGVTLDASDVVGVYASTANLTFQLYGSKLA